MYLTTVLYRAHPFSKSAQVCQGPEREKRCCSCTGPASCRDPRYVQQPQQRRQKSGALARNVMLCSADIKAVLRRPPFLFARSSKTLELLCTYPGIKTYSLRTSQTHVNKTNMATTSQTRAHATPRQDVRVSPARTTVLEQRAAAGRGSPGAGVRVQPELQVPQGRVSEPSRAERHDV